MSKIAYRSMSSATKTARARAEARFFWLKEIAIYLAEYLDFPRVNLPTFEVPNDPLHITMGLVEQIAQETREYWNLGDGPIADCVLLLENNGAVVSRGDLSAETLDAFSQWPADDPHPYVFLGADKNSAVRSRFDSLHELGHLILHRNVDPRVFRNKTVHRLIENQCHRYASSFLLPASSFTNELWSPTLNAFLTLKPRWKAAIACMIKRSEELGILDDEMARRMWINLNRRGWRKEEPLDDRLPVERPRLLSRSIVMLVESGIKTKEQILADLALPAHDLESLTGLPNGYFGSDAEMGMPKLKARGGSGRVVSIARGRQS
ncbi:MAG: ImmA/IrrE family metallo-endopeptidase [Bryobacterales bacterium]